MRPLTVLLTASGVPGCPALIRALRENGEREVRLVGTDMSELAIGRHFCDSFHLVPPGSDPGFADALVEICEREHVDAVLPQSSYDLLALAENKERFGETRVLVAGPEAVRRSNDKAATYGLLLLFWMLTWNEAARAQRWVLLEAVGRPVVRRDVPEELVDDVLRRLVG